MNSGNEKIPAGLRFIGRSLGDLLELKARCRRRLEYLEQNRDKISDYVFRKLHQEYTSYLETVDGEVALGLSEYEIRLSEIKLFSNQLKLLEKTYEEKIQELSLRHQLGEYDREQFDKLCSDHEERLKRFGRSLEKYYGQQRQLEDFLARIREERLAVFPAPALAEEAQPEVPPLEEEPAGLLVAGEVSEPVSLPEAVVQTPAVVQPVTAEPVEPEAPAPVSEETEAPPQDAPAAELLVPTPLTAEPEPAGSVEPETLEPFAGEAAAALESLEQVEAQAAPLTAEEALPAVEIAQEAEAIEAAPAKESPQEGAAELIEDLSVQPRSAEAEGAVEEEMLPLGIGEGEKALVEDNLPAIEEITGKPGQQEEEAAVEEEFAVDEVERQVESMVESAAAQKDEADGLPGLRQVGEEAGQMETAEVEVPREEPQPAQSPAASGGFSLEDIFSQTAAARAPEAPAPPPEVESAAPAGPGEIDREEVVQADIGESAPAELPSEAAVQEASATGGDSSLDLDAIISAAGASLEPTPASAAILATPPAFQQEPEPVEQDEVPVYEPEAALEPGLAEAQVAGEEAPALVEQQPAAASGQVEDEELMELRSAAVSESREGEAEEEFQIERAAALEEGVELQLGTGGEESEADKLLTVNQTLDAIKKKTVKCPNCGTMNYAIRWYCENCEATLTSL